MKFLIRAGVLVVAILAPFGARATPNFVVEQVRMLGGDNLPSTVEPVTMKVVLRNDGSDAEGVEADLLLTDGGQYIQELKITHSAFGSIAAGECGDNAKDPFAFITSSYQSEAPVRFELQIRAAGGFQQTLPLPAAQTTLGIRGDFPAEPVFLGVPISFDGDTMVSGRVQRLGQQAHVFVSDLNSYQERRLSDQESQQARPSISGQMVVWMDDRFRGPNQFDILLKDLSTEVEQRLTTRQAMPSSPQIDGRRVVWQDRRNGRQQVYLYDLDIGVERQLTFEPVDHNYPKISGDRIIWWDNHTGVDQVYVYDLSTDTQTQISEDGGAYPQIAGDHAVYLTDLNSFVLYDFAPGERTRVTTPELNGNAVVGTDFVVFPAHASEEDPTHVFTYEIATGTLRQITTHPASQRDPAIAGDRTVWIDFRNGFFTGGYFLSNLVASTLEGALAYATNQVSESATVIDTASHALVATVPGVGFGTFGLDFAPF